MNPNSDDLMNMDTDVKANNNIINISDDLMNMDSNNISNNNG